MSYFFFLPAGTLGSWRSAAGPSRGVDAGVAHATLVALAASRRTAHPAAAMLPLPLLALGLVPHTMLLPRAPGRPLTQSWFGIQ